MPYRVERGRAYRRGRMLLMGFAPLSPVLQSPRLLHRVPDPLRRRRHVELGHAERLKCVQGRVDHRRQCADRARLPCPFCQIGRAHV